MPNKMGFFKWLKNQLKPTKIKKTGKNLKRQDSVKSGEIDPMFQA